MIRDFETMKKLVPDVRRGNALILISGSEKAAPGIDVAFDCGLAAQNMYLAAQALGLGSHMYTGPIAGINANHKNLLGLPKGYVAVALLKDRQR